MELVVVLLGAILSILVVVVFLLLLIYRELVRGEDAGLDVVSGSMVASELGFEGADSRRRVRSGKKGKGA